MSIATQIAALQTDKTDIASAITTKGGTVTSGDGFDNFASDILTIPTGGGDDHVAVRFLDYDGTVVYEWTEEQLDNAGSLPSAPSHSQDAIPMTARSTGWNWTLADIKSAYELTSTTVNVGALYELTRDFIVIKGDSVTISINFKGTTTAVRRMVINWGDGSTDNVNSKGGVVNKAHSYSDEGPWTIQVYGYRDATQSNVKFDIYDCFIQRIYGKFSDTYLDITMNQSIHDFSELESVVNVYPKELFQAVLTNGPNKLKWMSLWRYGVNGEWPWMPELKWMPNVWDTSESS